jgi:hypothetical protein
MWFKSLSGAQVVGALSMRAIFCHYVCFTTCRKKIKEREKKGRKEKKRRRGGMSQGMGEKWEPQHS